MTHHSSSYIALALALLLALPFLISADNSSNETNASFANTSLDVSGGGTAGSVPQQTSTPPDFLVTLQGVMTLAKDVIIDLGKGDFELVIEGPQISEKPVVTPPTSDELGTPVVDLTPRTPHIVKAADLPQEHANRKADFETKKTKIVRAPKEKDLPVFRMQITPEIQNVISRGTVFPVTTLYSSEGELNYKNGSLIPLTDARRLVHPDLASKMHEAHLDTPLRMIVMYKQDVAGKDANAYGRMVIETRTFKSVSEMTAGAASPYAFVTYDTPVRTEEMTVEAVDSVIQGIDARQAYNVTGAVGVCLIDSGINYNLPALVNNYVGGYDFVNNDSDPLDDESHGTKMAHALVTVAPGAQLYAAKVLDNTGAGYTSDVIKAIDWCMQQNVSVISMSLGAGTYPGWCDANLLAQKANEAVARGFFVVAAAGNNGSTIMTSPACGQLVTSVGATDARENETIWNKSGLSNATDLLAPGAGVLLLNKDGTNVSVSGTSVSTAFAAGAAAVVYEQTAFNPQQLQDRLRGTGLLFTGYNNLSYPRVNVLAALNNAQNGLDLTQYAIQSVWDTFDKVYKTDNCAWTGDPCDGMGDTTPCTNCAYCNQADAVGECDIGVCIDYYGPQYCSYENIMCNEGAGGSYGNGNVCTLDMCGNTVDDDGSYTDIQDVDCGLGGCSQCTVSAACCDTTYACYRASGTKSTCAMCLQCSGDQSNCAGYIPINTADSGLCSGSTGCENAQCACDGTGNCDIQNGYACSAGSQCIYSNCLDSVYQGSATSSRCMNDLSYCVDSGGTVRSNTYNDGTNTCYGSSSGTSVWLANSGRWIVRKPDTTVLAVIDKYGSMGIRGTYLNSQTGFENGWQLNSGGSTQASINSANGNLRIRGTGYTERGTPSGTGFQVKNTGGTMEAIINATGYIILKGDFAFNLGSLA